HARPHPPGGRQRARRPGAEPAHRRTHRAVGRLVSRRPARARRRRRHTRAGRGPTGRGTADGLRRLPARPIAVAMITPARTVAFAVLGRVFEHGAYADRAFHAEAEGLEPRERGLAMRLAYGTIQR